MHWTLTSQIDTCHRSSAESREVDVFPSNYLNKSMDHAAMISDKRGG